MKGIIQLILLLWVLSTQGLRAQQSQVTLTSYSNETRIVALQSITLKLGFHIPSGKSVTLSLQQYPNLLNGVSANQNYILTRTFRKPVKVGDLNQQRTIAEENQSVQYFDGLGRSMQTVQVMGSPAFKDIVQHMEYDGFGRQTHQYLPYAEQSSNNGSYKSSSKTNQSNYYKSTGWDTHVNKTTRPYAVTVFENSPLNRVKEQGSAGVPWQPSSSRTATTGRTVVTEYGTNVATATEAVKLWQVNAANNGAASTGNYLAGRLYKTMVKDENWVSGKGGTVEEYRDFEDRVVLKRVWESESKKLDTYYVYDDFGDLRFVIPPGVSPSTNSFTVSVANATTHVYAYKYDGRRRLVEKWLPGKGVEYIVYNKNDQPILTQDAVQRIAKQWSYTKYDAFGRVVNTGRYTNTAQTTREQVQQLVDAHKVNNVAYYWEERNNTLNYTNRSFPTSGRVMQVWHYYDDYDFKETTFLPPSVDTSSLVKTLLTGTRVYLEDGTQGKLTVYYYDKHARMVQSPSQNHLGGTDYLTNTYSFVGELLTSKQEHKPSSGSTTTILTSNTYDHVGRLLDTKKKVNSQAEVVQSRLTYNEIGQLRRKLLHGENGGSKFIDTVDYAYNERGWVKDLKSPYFTQQLRYIDPVSGDDAEPQYNGNIAQSRWGYGKSFTDRFHYHYDKLNRLKDGHKLAGALMREQLVYDDMGNITNLKRDNHSTGVNYSYSGNRLLSVSGQLTGTYTYDANANATKDRAEMNFTYNHLNLPRTVSRTGTNTRPAVSIQYLYDALGTKLRKTATVGSTTTIRDYVGGIEYSKVGGADPAIELIHTEEGYLQRDNNNVYTYHYHLKDHLGNVRAVLQRTSATSGTVIQKQDYYPFGKTKSIANSGINRYLYNSKEVQPELGNQLDYGARFYDAEIGRWNVVDPLADQFENVSPYNYAMNNPVLMIDPDGMAADTIRMQEIFINAPKREPVQGVWGNIVHVWNGGNYDGFQYDRQGNPLGLSPTMGMPPDFSLSKPVKLLELAWKIDKASKAAKSIETLLKAGKALDKGGFTAVGRALQKHGSRVGSAFPKAKGNASAINAQGEAVLKGILTNSNVTSATRHHARFGNVLEYRIPGGQGARFSSDGKKFIGFIEP